MTAESITTGTEFTATLAVTSGPPAVDLRVDVEGLHFVPGIIPDGQLAGRRGHLEEQWTSEYTWRLRLDQARRLRDELNDALGEDG